MQVRTLRRALPAVRRLRCVAERLPHVHHGEPDFAAFLRPPIRRGTAPGWPPSVLATEPDRPPSDQVADDNAIGGMALRTEISSMPITTGKGAPASAS